MYFLRATFLFLFLGAGFCFSQSLRLTHSHNDYLQPRPLFGAIENGMSSIEADVFRSGEDLILAHVVPMPGSSRTLKALYLEPIAEMIREGKFPYDSLNPLTLMIDFKTPWESTLPLLLQQLEPYQSFLCSWTGEKSSGGLVAILISGSRPPASFFSDNTRRYVILDGNPAELGKNHPQSLFPRISLSWRGFSGWKGKGEVPPGLREKISSLAAQCQSEGRTLRFWATPDRKAIWDLLLSCGDNICLQTDKPEKLAKYLRARSPETLSP